MHVRSQSVWLSLLVLATSVAAGRAADPEPPATLTSTTTGMVLALVPAGEFQMGSPPAEPGRRPDEAPHRVRITRPFYLGTREVTQGDYLAITGRNPSSFAAEAEGGTRVEGRDTSRLPVENVSWFDAVEFCNLLGAKDGLPAYYRLDDVKRRADGGVERADVFITGGAGYRLPTEAEWEYACRAGTVTAFHYGARTTGKDANCKPSADAGAYGLAPGWREVGRTAVVGSYPANAWGLHEMHGNVAEWCWDRYAERPEGGSDPAGPPRGDHRVLRGGSWLFNERSCRAANRFMHVPGERSYDTGFRVARTPQ